MSAAIVVAVALASAPTASAAVRLVAPSGADSGNCLSAPCATFGYAYGQAASGDEVSIAPGVYGRQVVPGGSKQVVFRGLPGNKVRQLDNSASNVTFDGIDIDAGFTTPNGAAFENHGDPGGQNVVFRNGRVGNVIDQKGALLGGHSSTAPMNVVIDNVEFHDVVQQGPEVHNECIFSQTPGLTIRNSTFRNCATMDLFVVRGDWWGQPPYGGVTLENNVFGHSVNGSGWHYYSLYWSNDAFENVRVVNNTFENAVILDNVGGGPYSGVWANNIGGGWSCLAGVTFRNNVGKSCHSSDKAVNPAFSCHPPACNPGRTMPVGWVDPAGFDFQLAPSSPAVNAGSAAYAPAHDKRGLPRDPRPDAGAYEYGAQPGNGGGPSSGSPGSTPGAGWRLRSAGLRPRVICRSARPGCPASTKLRLRLGRPAKVTVAVKRVRKGGKSKRVRRLARHKVAVHKAFRLRARGLKVGRYHVVVRATDASGRISAPVRLRLRVR